MTANPCDPCPPFCHDFVPSIAHVQADLGAAKGIEIPGDVTNVPIQVCSKCGTVRIDPSYLPALIPSSGKGRPDFKQFDRS